MNLLKSFLVIALLTFAAKFDTCTAQIGHQESEKDYWYAYIDGLWADGGLGLSSIGKAAITDFNFQFGDSLLFTLGGSKTWERASNLIRATDYFATAGYIIKKKKSIIF